MIINSKSLLFHTNPSSSLLKLMLINTAKNTPELILVLTIDTRCTIVKTNARKASTGTGGIKHMYIYTF